MAKVKLARNWFDPKGVLRRKGVHEVPEAWLEESEDKKRIIPKTAEVLPEAEEPKAEEKPKAAAKK